MPKVLVVCYGNPLRGDDGVGWIVAEKLQQRSLPDFVFIQTHIQLTPEQAADLSEADLAIFIDACDGNLLGLFHASLSLLRLYLHRPFHTT